MNDEEIRDVFIIDVDEEARESWNTAILRDRERKEGMNEKSLPILPYIFFSLAVLAIADIREDWNMQDTARKKISSRNA